MARSPEYSAFISYATPDSGKAREICAQLEARGLRCWIAPRDVRAGREYANEIITGIERSRCVVLVLSTAANESQFVAREVERAVAKGRPVIPIRLEPVVPSPGLEPFVSAEPWIDARSGGWEGHLDRLVRDLAWWPLAAGTSGGRAQSAQIAAGSTLWSARRVLFAAALLALILVIAGVGYCPAFRSLTAADFEVIRPGWR